MMPWRAIFFGLLELLAVAAPAAEPPAAAAPAQVVALTVDGAISPASADYVVRGIDAAAQRGAQAVLLQLDTPGGLASAMREITKAILNSPVPVIGYVAPQGARAASAGTFILYACHVAAMAPATNIGAATPVSITGAGSVAPASSAGKAGAAPAGSAEMRKLTNDAVASIRALAERRGRNADWAEQAVRDAASITAQQALKEHVIDLVAPSVPALLASVDGRTLETTAGARVLHTRDAMVVPIVPDARSRFLAVIADPSVALVLLLLGIGGLVMEGTHPGVILPGVVGAISLLLALYAFQLLPVNFVGLGLMVLGAVLIVSEAFVPAYGVLGTGGVVALVIGAVVLMRTGSAASGIALPAVLGISLAGAGVMAGIVWLAARSRRQRVVSGSEEMMGAVGAVVADFQGRGLVHVHGEHWQAESAVPLQRGQPVVVTGRRGLVLDVRAAAPKPESRP
ncbi:MAG: nodulation protein NfeD [Burkholderiales bacterium]|nr:nodulation protein NfeD [Burkholderiales bacterium]